MTKHLTSAPFREAACGFYFYLNKDSKSPSKLNSKFLCYYNFGSLAAGKKFIEACLQNNDYEWVDFGRSTYGETIKDSTGLIIDGHGLEECIDYKLTKEETEWELPSPYSKYALTIRLDRDELEIKALTADSPSKKPKPTRSMKIDKTGLISIKKISSSLNISPKDARTILRKAKISKPQGGWLWKDSDVEEVKQIISKGLETFKKGKVNV